MRSASWQVTQALPDPSTARLRGSAPTAASNSTARLSASRAVTVSLSGLTVHTLRPSSSHWIGELQVGDGPVGGSITVTVSARVDMTPLGSRTCTLAWK